MRAAPLLYSWHDDNSPIYSAHFEPHPKGRLATAGGDSNVRVRVHYIPRSGGAQRLIVGQIWSVESDGDERKVSYLSTLKKHTSAVNVVRWCPKGTCVNPLAAQDHL